MNARGTRRPRIRGGGGRGGRSIRNPSSKSGCVVFLVAFGLLAYVGAHFIQLLT